MWKPITVSPLYIEISKYLKHHGWLQDCWILAGKKNLLYKSYIKNPSPESKFKFITYRNKFKKNQTISDKKLLFHKILCKWGRPRTTWKAIKEIMGKGHQLSPPTTFKDQDGLQITSQTEISGSFIHYFSNIDRNLASKISHSHKSFEEFFASFNHPLVSDCWWSASLDLLNIQTAQDMTRLIQKLLSLLFLLLLMSWHQ